LIELIEAERDRACHPPDLMGKSASALGLSEMVG
jgi:hypothetical protein